MRHELYKLGGPGNVETIVYRRPCRRVDNLDLVTYFEVDNLSSLCETRRLKGALSKAAFGLEIPIGNLKEQLENGEVIHW